MKLFLALIAVFFIAGASAPEAKAWQKTCLSRPQVIKELRGFVGYVKWYNDSWYGDKENDARFLGFRNFPGMIAMELDNWPGFYRAGLLMGPNDINRAGTLGGLVDLIRVDLCQTKIVCQNGRCHNVGNK